MCKYIFVTGGVCSSLGKGITAASLGRLLINRGLKVLVQKFDPYLNVDPGTMSPYQHGEVFVTEDGAETDLDIGHYERFLDLNCDINSDFTSGRIYSNIIRKERSGQYFGGTVQVVPHVTNEIKDAVRSVGKKGVDVVIVEIGGTVGDIEGLPFLEAIRQIKMEMGEKNCLFVHVTLLPYLEAAGEVKTKPTQHSVKELTGLGIQPDIIVCRTNKTTVLNDEFKRKIALFCNLRNSEEVIHNKDCDSIYEVPMLLEEQRFDKIVLKKLHLKAGRLQMKDWKSMVAKLKKSFKEITVAIVGKYTQTPDAYISVTEAIKHAGASLDRKVKVKLVDSEAIEKLGTEKLLSDVNGIVVPGGFGDRGVEGKILAAKFARENNIPYLGIGLGMQTSIIEFARNVLKLKNANSSEFDAKCKHCVIDSLEDPKSLEIKGGAMRLGSYECHISPNTISAEVYGETTISERHRNKYELKNEYKNALTEKGMVMAGVNKKLNVVEIIELKNHPYYVGAQFHAEFKSRPYRPHPLFVGLIQAIKNHK